MSIKPAIKGCIRTYDCPNCGQFSVLHHDPKTRAKVCQWCKSKVKRAMKENGIKVDR